MKKPLIKTGDSVRFVADGFIGKINRDEMRLKYFVDVMDRKMAVLYESNTTLGIEDENGLLGWFSQERLELCNCLNDVAEGDVVEVFDAEAGTTKKHTVTRVTDTMFSIEEDVWFCKLSGGSVYMNQADRIKAIRIIKTVKPVASLKKAAPGMSVELYDTTLPRNMQEHKRIAIVTVLDGRIKCKGGIVFDRATGKMLKNPSDQDAVSHIVAKAIRTMAVLEGANKGDIVRTRGGQCFEIDDIINNPGVNTIYLINDERYYEHGRYGGTAKSPESAADIISYGALRPVHSAFWAIQMMSVDRPVKHILDATGVYRALDLINVVTYGCKSVDSAPCQLFFKHMLEHAPWGWYLYEGEADVDDTDHA